MNGDNTVSIKSEFTPFSVAGIFLNKMNINPIQYVSSVILCSTIIKKTSFSRWSLSDQFYLFAMC